MPSALDVWLGECPRRWTCGRGSALGEIAGASRGSYGCCAPPAASAREAGSPRRRHARSCSGCGRRRDGGRGAGPEQRHDGGPGAAVHSGRGPAHGQCCWLLVVPTAAAAWRRDVASQLLPGGRWRRGRCPAHTRCGGGGHCTERLWRRHRQAGRPWSSAWLGSKDAGSSKGMDSGKEPV